MVHLCRLIYFCKERLIKKESLLIREEPMKVLKEFEAIEFDNY